MLRFGRVQIPAYSDNWMQGDRYGVLVGSSREVATGKTIARIKLDKSGKVVRFYLDDCTEVQ